MPKLHFAITDHGAIARAGHANEAAIQSAIDAAHAQGGGVVYIPPGTWESGGLRLRSHVTLHLANGAILLASPDIQRYPAMSNDPTGNRHLLFAENEEHITIEGDGIIDGNVRVWTIGADNVPPYTWTGLVSQRPSPMNDFRNCRHLRLRNITIQNSPGWTVRLRTCTDIVIQGVRVFTYVYSGNSDGFDFVGCHDVLVSDCQVETGDDAFVFKCYRNTRSCERVTITNCIIKTNCAALRLGAETHDNYRHFTFSNSVVYNSVRAVDIISMDGSVIEDISVSNLVIETDSSITMNRAIHLEVRKGRSEWGVESLPLEHQKPGVIRRVTLSNITLRTDGRILLTATDGGILENITLRDIHMSYPWIEDPVAVKDQSDSMQCSNYCPEARHARAAVVVMNAHNFQLHNLVIDWPRAGEPAAWAPKYEGGQQLVLPQDTQFHAFWGKNIQGGVLDIPLAQPSSPALSQVHLENCSLIQR